MYIVRTSFLRARVLMVKASLFTILSLSCGLLTMETPPLRVSRPVSACARCRSAKIKCDGKLPACSACERAGKAKDCSSANDQFAKGKERSYVASLESRIERLRRQISLSRGESGGLSDAQRPGGLYLSHPTKRTQTKDASDVDELVSDFGYL